MSDVINGVPRELLERLLDSDGIDGVFDAGKNYAAHQELRALLSEQPQSSVSCVACEGRPSGDNVPCAVCGQPQSSAAQSAPAGEREAFEAELGSALLAEQGKFALSRAYEEGRPYTFLATKWAFAGFQAGASWQRAQSAPVVPEGYVLVRADPTPEMIRAGVLESVGALRVYFAMLAAAPQPDQFVEATDMVTARQEQGDDCVLFGFDDRSVRVSQEAYSIFLEREHAAENEVRRLREALEEIRRADMNAPVSESNAGCIKRIKQIAERALAASAEGKA